MMFEKSIECLTMSINLIIYVCHLYFFILFRMGVQIPGAWQGVPAQAQIPAAQIPTAQSVGSALPQATGVVAYPMQQFQVSPQVHRIHCS